MAENKIVQQNGRIFYVDPNDVFDFGGDNGDVPLTPPYEDMSIAFNLIIEKYDRFGNQKPNQIGFCWCDKLNGDGHYNVLNGSISDENGIYDSQGNRYLSTYYVDISADGYNKGEQIEGLGVSSIQVAFDSYYTPTVVINFVDVRGSALFGREEAIHTSASGNGEINASNVFGSFFTIPYPKFKLQMKGFFGKAVTYQLTVTNFKANFNAQTGNVEATVQFVGYTWSLLTDIPLQYLVAAPYCNYIGKKYWNEHKKQNSWLLTGDVEPPTLYEFFTAIRSCIYDSEHPGNDTEDDGDVKLHNENSIAQELINNINKIKTFLTDSETIANHKGDIENCFNDINVGVVSLSDVIDVSKKPSKAYEKIGTFKEKTETYFDSNWPSYSSSSYGGSISLDNGITLPSYPQFSFGGTTVIDNGRSRNFFTPSSTVERIQSYFDNFYFYYPSSFEELKIEVNQLIEDNNSKLEENRRRKESEFIRKSIDKIGFIPNIYNIFKILMCHLETFCHILFEAGNEIKQQGDGRLASALGVENTNTDLPERLAFEQQQLPAWTAIFNRKNASTQTVDELKYVDMYRWVGAIAPNKWVEERVVWSLQNAIQYVAKDQKGNTNNSTTVRKINYIPVLPCDIFNTNAPFNNTVNNDFPTFVGHLSLRIAQILGVMDTELSNDNTMLETVAKADAYNFFYSCQNIDDIKTLITNNTSEGNAADIISGMAVCDSRYDYKAPVQKKTGNSRYVYEYNPNAIGCLEGRHNIFKLNNGKYDYTYFLNENRKYYVPTKLVPFTKNGYDTFIASEVFEDETVFNGVIINKKSNKWLTNVNSNDYLNYDEFNIIDNEEDIKQLEDIYAAIKNNSFKVNGYTPPMDELSTFVDRYWKLGFEDYKKYIPSLPDDFIGKSYEDYFNSDYPKPNKNDIINDYGTLERAIRGNNSIETYEVGDEYGKIGTDSIDDFYIKALYVYDRNGNKTGTLFGHPFYYTQNQITNSDNKLCAKACLFLQSLSRSSEYFDHNLHTEHGAFGVYNKLNILYIGSLLWRQRNVDNDEDHINDGIRYDNPDGGPQYSRYVRDNKVLTMGSVKGLYIVKSTESLPDKCIDINQYIAEETDNNLYNNLNENIKTQLIKYFIKFATKDFVGITNKCELYDGVNPYADGWYCQEYLNNMANTDTIETICIGKCYLVNYLNKSNPNSIYSVFDEEETKKNDIQKKIKDVVFGKVVLMNSCAVGKAKKDISIPSSAFKGYINGFVNKLNEIVSGLTTGEDYSSTNLTDGEAYNENLLLAIYLYCKNIWEKWLMPLSRNDLTDDDGSEQFDVSVFFEENFKFIDTYYNDIGNLLKINLDKLLKKYDERIDEGSLFAFIGDIVAEHRCIFVGLPDFVNFGLGVNGKSSDEAVKNLENIFRPVPFNQMETPRLNNNFVVIYTYPPAKQLPDSVMYSYDGFDIYSKQDSDVLSAFKVNGAKEKITEQNAVSIYNQEGITKIGYNIPAFGVCFAKQNNHLFKNFNISMDNPMETEQSIKTLWHAAEIAKGNYNKVCFYGQDVYNIFSNYSYQIEVEMMGNAQIQPLMYFQLLNIPMWRGAYMIFNVSHTMTPGNMVTKFKGMKMSKNPVPILSKYWSFINGKGEDTDYDNDDNIGDYDAAEFKSSGIDNNISNKGASANNMDMYKPLKGYCEGVDSKYYNRGDNNYYMPQLSTYEFKMLNGKTFNLKHAINFIYNMAHVNTKKCEIKKCTDQSSMCARHVWAALGAGGLNVQGRGSHAWEINTNNAAMQQQAGYKQIFNEGGRLPEYAMPGDVVLKKYKNKHGEDSGHAEFFTGKHWVSDVIQPKGLTWAGAAGKPNKDEAFKTIYAIWRIPNIEKALVGTSSGDGSINPPSGGKSIFETNSNYSENAICEYQGKPKGKFEYTSNNIKKCVLYFVAHGEGGNTNPTGNKSTDYCGINNNRYNTSFYTAERKRVLNATPQNGFVAAYDNAVFNFYYNYFNPYKEFFESCRNPFTRYMGLLALKAGYGYYGQGWKRIGGQDMNKLSDLDYTSKLAREWINLIENGYTDSDGKVYKGYGTKNKAYWASVKKAEKYNQIYE